MSTDPCLACLARRDWLLNGPLSNFISSYIEALQSRRYARGTIGAYLRCLAHFSYWMKYEGVPVTSIDHALIERFIRLHFPICTCPAPCRSVVSETRAALHHLLALLRDAGAATSKTMSPMAIELQRFHDHLQNLCGLASSTCTYRVRHLEAFFTSRFEGNVPSIERLTIGDIDSFLHDLGARWKPSSRGVICTSLRSYLRFRAMRGDDTRILTATLPAIANWPRRSPPKVLSDVQLRQFLQAFDVSDPVGLRDYAIARCILDLGLRGDEAAHLTLDCVDWRNGIVMLHRTKSQRAQHLPLPVQTGEALTRYLREGRPRTDSRAIFVRHRAPFGVPLTVPAIRNAMNRAFARSGLADQFCSTHVLRRSTATRLQKAGVSVKEISDLLRHRSLNTARVYARVDLEGLRSVALPWPGSTS
ncbi:site-specific integrase [Burkholderia diffusa]|uniref:site-specific integrase n=1 Tax=Burkholderia diffusa TaxID=488732 RepID=UPI002ABE5CE6|nr:site-specific integrase [Burkholderia diffusa]